MAAAAAASLSPRLVARWEARRHEAVEAVRTALRDGTLAAPQAEARAAERLAMLLHKVAGTAGMFGEAALGEAAAALERFAGGFTKVERHGDKLRLVDLRMGQEPNYSFSFRVAQRGSEFVPVTPQNQGWRGDVKRALAWLGPRMLGHDLPPPR